MVGIRIGILRSGVFLSVVCVEYISLSSSAPNYLYPVHELIV